MSFAIGGSTKRSFSLAGLTIILIACGSSSDADHVPSDGAEANIRTGAERRLSEWLSALNSGDTVQLRRVADSFTPAALSERNALDRARRFAFWHQSFGPLTQPHPDSLVGRELETDVALPLFDNHAKVYVEVDSVPPYRVAGISMNSVLAADDSACAVKSGHADTLRESLASLLNRVTDAQVFSGVVLVTHRDSAVFMRVAPNPVSTSTPLTLESRFEIASLSKLFTASAILRLVHAQKLSLHDSLARLLPEFVGLPAQNVTVAQLLTHSSGMPDLFRNRKYHALKRPLDKLSDLWPAFMYDSLQFLPGTQWDYSNSGYIVLGSIIERTSGEPFEAAMRRLVFDPAGMRHTGYSRSGFPPTAIPLSKYASFNYSPGGDPDLAGWHAVPSTFVRPPAPSGGAISTSADLVAFTRALLSGKLFSPAALSEMLTPRLHLEGDGQQALGFQLYKWAGQQVVSHSGSSWGVSTQLDVLPEKGFTAVILGNVDLPSVPVLAARIRTLVACDVTP